jgi:hypothetical protein
MALTPLQREICRSLAAARRASGEAYVAGGVALTTILGSSRLSEDIDIFHDAAEAVRTSFEADRRLLQERGLAVIVVHDAPTFVRARVEREGETVIVEWAQDSAYRFFPLVESEELGLTLHPFDLATNKTLAAVGRLEARDWVDLVECHDRVQPLGLLAWAAAGKDPGLTPGGIVAFAARSRYAAEELLRLGWDGPPPDPGDLARRWRRMLQDAPRLQEELPADRVGHAVLGPDGAPFQGDAARLRRALRSGAILFHPAMLRGSFPRLVG